MINWFETIKNYYDEGCYTIENIETFVLGNKIDEVQFQKITGVKKITLSI